MGAGKLDISEKVKLKRMGKREMQGIHTLYQTQLINLSPFFKLPFFPGITYARIYINLLCTVARDQVPGPPWHDKK